MKKGYAPKTERLHHDDSTLAGCLLLAAACRKHQAEMLAWAAGYGRKRQYDGTIAGLVREYETHKASPHLRVKWNTRRNDQQVLGVIEKAFGKRVLAALKIDDIYRWHEEAAKPKTRDGEPRMRKAYGIIKMLRQLFNFGIMAELPECPRLAAILPRRGFLIPNCRRVRLELHHVRAFIPKAIETGSAIAGAWHRGAIRDRNAPARLDWRMGANPERPRRNRHSHASTRKLHGAG